MGLLARRSLYNEGFIELANKGRTNNALADDSLPYGVEDELSRIVEV